MEETPDKSEVMPYLAVLLHALNQPLTALASYVEAASQASGEDLDPLVREALEGARSESARAVTFAREMRAVLRECAPSPLGAVDLTKLLPVSVRELNKQGDVRATLTSQPGLPHVQGDALTLRRALLSLARCAAGHLGANVQLELIARRSPETARQVEVAAEFRGAPEHVPPPLAPGEIPMCGLARSAVADLGGELILAGSTPGSLRYLIRLATA